MSVCLSLSLSPSFYPPPPPNSSPPSPFPLTATHFSQFVRSSTEYVPGRHAEQVASVAILMLPPSQRPQKLLPKAPSVCRPGAHLAQIPAPLRFAEKVLTGQFLH